MHVCRKAPVKIENNLKKYPLEMIYPSIFPGSPRPALIAQGEEPPLEVSALKCFMNILCYWSFATRSLQIFTRPISYQTYANKFSNFLFFLNVQFVRWKFSNYFADILDFFLCSYNRT